MWDCIMLEVHRFGYLTELVTFCSATRDQTPLFVAAKTMIGTTRYLIPMGTEQFCSSNSAGIDYWGSPAESEKFRVMRILSSERMVWESQKKKKVSTTENQYMLQSRTHNAGKPSQFRRAASAPSSKFCILAALRRWAASSAIGATARAQA